MNYNFSSPPKNRYYVDISPRITFREKKLLFSVFEIYKKYRKNPVKLSETKILQILEIEKNEYREKIKELESEQQLINKQIEFSDS